MRYELGEKVIGINVRFSSNGPRWSNLYFPDTDKLEGIDLIDLTVIEHAKVPWDQDPDGEKKYDGYVLRDEKGVIFHNQYPSAGYGQMDDSANWKFSYAELTDENFLVRYEDVTQYLKRILRFLARETENTSESLRSALLEHYIEVISQIRTALKVSPIYSPREGIHYASFMNIEFVPNEEVGTGPSKLFTFFWKDGRRETAVGYDVMHALSKFEHLSDVDFTGAGAIEAFCKLDSIVEGDDDKLVYTNRIGEEGTDKPKVWRELKIPTVVE